MPAVNGVQTTTPYAFGTLLTKPKRVLYHAKKTVAMPFPQMAGKWRVKIACTIPLLPVKPVTLCYKENSHATTGIGKTTYRFT